MLRFDVHIPTLSCVMFLLNLSFTFIIFAAADIDKRKQSSETGYCIKDSTSCDNKFLNTDSKLIFYDVNPAEGFNLRRDVYMRFAIMLSDARKSGKTDWELVLPPWYNLYHWKTDRKQSKPWNKYFDIESLKLFAPVIEMYEIFKKTNNVLEIDTLYNLLAFEDAFENGVFEDKWQVVGKCKHNNQFWGYKNITAKEVVCVKFQGKTSKLWELISLHPADKKIMFSHGEIPLHDNYGTKTYWDCRKSMKFNKKLVGVAKNYRKKYLNCDKKKCKNYLSVHWRRQDFARSRGNDVPTIAGTVTQILDTMKTLQDIKKIFIATDASMSEITELERELSKYGYETNFFLPSPEILEEYGDGGIAIIDQIICSHAAYFIGTHESTFTYRIQEEREILGFNSDSTFNRLCPDVGLCEKPSRWTIVN